MCTQAIQNIYEFVSLSDQIWRNVALNHLLTCGSYAVNDSKQCQWIFMWEDNKMCTFPLEEVLLWVEDLYFYQKWPFKVQFNVPKLNEDKCIGVWRWSVYLNQSDKSKWSKFDFDRLIGYKKKVDIYNGIRIMAYNNGIRNRKHLLIVYLKL